MRKYLCLVCGLLLAPVVRADDASHRAAATELVDHSDIPTSMRAGFMAVIDPMVAGLTKQGLPEAAAKEVRQAVTDWYEAEVKWEEMKPKVVDLYLGAFTEAELRDMLAFYKSPTGQKALTTLPSLMQQSSKLGQDYFQAKAASLNERLEPIIQKYRGEKP